MQKLLIFILFIALVYSQTVQFQVQFRDFNITQGCNCDTYRTEFEGPINNDRGMVKFDLGPDRLPVYNYAEKQRSNGGTVSGKYAFDSFWKGGEDCIVTDIFLSLPFTQNGNLLTYSNTQFFPLDNMGYGNYGTSGHNFHFTMQMHTQFTYQGGESFTFSGDDDVWVFINNKLALDLGGVHGTQTVTFKLDDLRTSHGISVSGTYNFDFFFCERHTSGSNLIISTSIVVQPPNPPCQTDADSDGVPDCRDNCISIPNPDQRDCNFNGKGDVCDTEASRIEFPFESHFYYHYNSAVSTTDPYVFGQSTQFDNLASTSPMVISFNDFIPKDVIPNYHLEALVSIRNLGQVNCPVTLQFKSGTSLQSSSLFFSATPGDSFAIRNYALMNSFYTFANRPIGGGSEVNVATPGVNTFTITSTSAACNGNLSIGSVVVSTRFTLQTNNITNYYSKCYTQNDCQFGTKRFGGYCACWSGAFGISCTMDTGIPGNLTDPIVSQVDDAWSSTVPQINDPGVYVGLDLALMAGKPFHRNFTKHPTCPNLDNWQKVFDLQTGGVVQLDSAGFEGQNLVMYVSQPFVDGRADGAVFLNSDAFPLQKPECVYPRSKYIFKLVAGCKDIWKFQIPWTYARDCFWNQTEEDSHTVYSGRVIVHNQEWVGTEQWRIVRSVLRVKVRFQRYVSVETPQITGVAKYGANFAITKQIVALDLGNPALIEIGSLINWPYELYDVTFSKFPDTKIAKTNESYDGCTSQPGKSCRQYYRTSLYLTEGTCTLDGDYEFTLGLGCDEANKANCSLDSTDPAALKVQYTLKSENFCATITVDIGIIGKITSHENQTFIGTKSNFIVNRRIYFLVKVNSDLNEPKDSQGKVDIEAYNPNDSKTIIKFTKTELVTVSIRFSNQTIVRIWRRGALNAWGTLCQNHTVATTTPQKTLLLNSVGFSFIVTKDIANPAKNQKVTFTVLAEVQVTYPSSKKRADADDTSSYKTDTDVDPDPSDTATPTDTNTNTNTNTDTTTSTTTSTTAPTTAPTTESKGSNSAFALFASLIMLIVALI